MNNTFSTLMRADLRSSANPARANRFLCGESLPDAASCDAAQPGQVSPRQTDGASSNNHNPRTHFPIMKLQSFLTTLSLLVLLTGATHLRAGTHIWSGAVNGNWSHPGNWSSGGVPASGEAALVLRFPPEGQRLNVTNDLAQLTVQSIIFTSDGYRLAGTSITLASAGLGLNFLTSGPENEIAIPVILPNGFYTVSVPDTSRLILSGVISGPGALYKYSEGYLSLEGPNGNTFTGGFHLRGGRTGLVKATGVALPGPVFLGQTNSSAEMYLGCGAHHQIADSADVHVWGGNTRYDLNGYNDTVNSLELVDGTVTSGIWSYYPNGTPSKVPGILRINGDVTVAEAIRNDGYEPVLAGRLSLGNVQHTFTVPANIRLLFYAEVGSTGTNGGITLQGGGSLQMEGSNSFTGPLRIEAGDIYALDSAAFGSPIGGTYFTGENCEVTLGYGQFVNGEPLHVTRNARLVCIATNAWNGPIHVASNATLQVWGHNFGGTEKFTLSGPITGPGNLHLWMDRLDLVGTEPNTLSGKVEVFSNTDLHLNKTNANALAGTVYLNNGNAGYPYLYWHASHQLADSTRVRFEEDYSGGTGALKLNDFQDTIGSLHGGPYAQILCGNGRLTVGGNDQDSRFYGLINGNAGVTNLAKVGAGTFILFGSHYLQGSTLVQGGTLLLSNAVGVGAVHVSSGGRLAGSAKLGTLTASGTGRIEPGEILNDFSYGTLRPASFNLGSGVLRCGIGGTAPGTNCDQIVTSGPLFISGTSLELTTFNIPTGSNSYTIINVTNTGLTLGAFIGLPEGTQFTSLNGHNFRITYHGGDGNDVVVTRVDPPPPGAQVTGVTAIGNGQVQIGATGLPGMNYLIEATTSLAPANWIQVGNTTADGNGVLEFIDADAANYSLRFYRFVLP